MHRPFNGGCVWMRSDNDDFINYGENPHFADFFHIMSLNSKRNSPLAYMHTPSGKVLCGIAI